jgi:hypothetical protein
LATAVLVVLVDSGEATLERWKSAQFAFRDVTGRAGFQAHLDTKMLTAFFGEGT